MYSTPCRSLGRTLAAISLTAVCAAMLAPAVGSSTTDNIRRDVNVPSGTDHDRGGNDLPDNYEDSLPLLGDNSSSILSLAEERTLGLEWLQGLRGSVKMLKDPQTQHYLENLLTTLAQASELLDRTLYPIIIDNPSLNAFAAPGGIIGINTGLILKARSEGELSAVLAHELAHLSQRHYARRVQSGKLASVAGIVLILSSLLAVLSGGSDSGIAAIYAGTAALQASQLNYSRRDEREADRIGLRTLTRAGYSPLAVAQMFETLRDTYRMSSDRPPEYLLTHPYTEERLSDARARAQQLNAQNGGGLLDRPIFHIIKIRADVQSSSGLAQTTLQYESRLKAATGIERIFASYGLAMAYSQQNRYPEALRILAQLDSSQITQALELPLLMLKAEILLDSGENFAALELVRAQNVRERHLYPLDMLHARILMANRQYQEAEQIMRSLRTYRPEDPLVWEVLSDVQLLSGNALEYHRSSARLEELNGQYLNAVKHLQEAARLAEGDDQLQQALIDQRDQLAKQAYEHSVGN